MTWRWLLAAVLLAIGWAGNLTAFNWWAAGKPPAPHPKIYMFRGSIFVVFVSLPLSVRRQSGLGAGMVGREAAAELAELAAAVPGR